MPLSKEFENRLKESAKQRASEIFGDDGVDINADHSPPPLDQDDQNTLDNIDNDGLETDELPVDDSPGNQPAQEPDSDKAKLEAFATEAGLTADDISGFESVDELQRALRIADIRMHKLISTRQAEPQKPVDSNPGKPAEPKADDQQKVDKGQGWIEKFDTAIKSMKEKIESEELVDFGDMLGSFEVLREGVSESIKATEQIREYIRKQEDEQRSRLESEYQAQVAKDFETLESSIEELGISEVVGSRSNRSEKQHTALVGMLQVLQSVNQADAATHGKDRIPLTTEQVRRAALAMNLVKQSQPKKPSISERDKKILEQSRSVMGKSSRSNGKPEDANVSDELTAESALSHPAIRKFFADRTR
ncbi:hypothetical protein KC887_00265 [Candidatus Kaiserbacteria bacterium]|nr:hypothetical protein [Candidatus Kaiserbacteria bacterium]